MESLSLLNDSVQVQIPRWTSLNFNSNLPLYGPFSFSLSRFFFSSLFYFGIACTSYSVIRIARSLWRSTSIKVRSLYNAKKYLNPLSPIAEASFGPVTSEASSRKAYALIYGAGNRVGITFAHFLAEKGFNLILIERDVQPLNDLENSLREKFNAKGPLAPLGAYPLIHKVVLNKFDQDVLNERLHGVKDLPVKIFINCKNSKRKATPQVKFPGRHSEAPADEEFDIRAASEEIATREEVYFTAKENIEGFASLVNVFIRQLSVSFDNVGLINIDNYDSTKAKLRSGELFFQSTVQFKDTYTTLLGMQQRLNRNSNLKTINVKVSFKKLKRDGSFRKQQQLCEQTFNYLGLEDTIYVK